jgi:glycosyltransferase involved in cell wall biosynthesis
VHELLGRFPDADDRAIAAAGRAVDWLGQDLTVIDGLALPAFMDHVDRLPERWIGLIHHPLCMETGITEEEAADFATIEGRLMHRAARLVVTSPGTRRDLAGFDIDPARISVVLPGAAPAAPARGSVDREPRQLLTVGSLTRRKGHLTLLAALAGLLDLDWHLNMVGSAAWDPDHAAEIEHQVEALGLAKRVALIGEQDEAGLADQYDRADLFVLASHHEGYGMVLTEALARALPIVSTTAGAIPETVPAAAGRLVAPGDPDALAGALRSVLTDDDTYRRLAAGAAEARNNLQSWEASASQFAAVLDEVVGR